MPAHEFSHSNAHSVQTQSQSASKIGAESRHHDSGRPDVDQHGARSQEALDGQPIRRRNARAHRIVEIILEPRQDEPELAITACGRPPVERHHRGAVRAGRDRELGDADVQRADASGKQRSGFRAHHAPATAPASRAASRAASALLGARMTPAAESAAS